MFDPIIVDIEPLDITNSDVDLAVFHEIRGEEDTVVLVTRWKDFFEDFYSGKKDDFKEAFNRFCQYWKRRYPKEFRFSGVKACTLANGRRVIHDTPYDPNGVVSEQEVGTILYPCRLQKEAEYEMHHDYAQETAHTFEYTGPWVSALMVQAKIERDDRYIQTITWLARHGERLSAGKITDKERYVKDMYRLFWRDYFQTQRGNTRKGYGKQSKPLTILQRMEVKREFALLAELHCVPLHIDWPEGDGPRTLHDILQDKKEELSTLCESDDFRDLARAEEMELEIESLERRIRVDCDQLAPWITEWMTGIERDKFDGEHS